MRTKRQAISLDPLHISGDIPSRTPLGAVHGRRLCAAAWRLNDPHRSSPLYSATPLGAGTRAGPWRLGRRVRSRRRRAYAWGCDRRRLDPRRRRGTRRRHALRQSLRDGAWSGRGGQDGLGSAGPIAIIGSPSRWRNGRSGRRSRRFPGRPLRRGQDGLRSASRRNGETPRRCWRFLGRPLLGAQAGKASGMPERQLEPRAVRGRGGVHGRGRPGGPRLRVVRVVQDGLTRCERRTEHRGAGRGHPERLADGHVHSTHLARRAAGMRSTTLM
jgi:hypothetical protein